MANQFIIKNGLIVDQGGAVITGSSSITGSLAIVSSGSGVFTVDGTAGRLFSIDDSLSGSLFSVNTAAGLPVIEAFSDNTVRIGQYGKKALFISQSSVGIGKEATLNTILDVSGSAMITGSLNVSSGITGSLFGTSSWAVSSSTAISSSYSISSSYAATASYFLTSSVTSASYASTASLALNFVTSSVTSASLAATASYFITSSVTSASLAATASYFITSSVTSASLAATASYFITSSITSASYAQTASAASNFVIGNSLTASNALITGTITAQTLVVQTITSSVEYSSGSNIFGSQLTNTQQFTGSILATGSLHRFFGIISSSNTIHVDVVQPTYALDTIGRILYSNYYAQYDDLPPSNTYHGMFAHVHATGSAYYSHGSHGWVRLWDTYNNPGLISGSQVVENIAGQAIAPLSVSASSFISASQFAGSGSGIVGVVSSSYALTASYVAYASSFPYTGSAKITGSLDIIGTTSITGSLSTTGSNTLIGNTQLTGSLKISGSETIDGYIQFNPVSTNIDTSISASYIYVSGSTQDLYFSQNNKGYSNTTRLRWLEGNLYSGLLNGGLITTQSSTVYQVSSGSAILVNLNASILDNPYPVIQYLNWNNLSASIAPLTSSFDQSFVAVLSNSTIGVQGTPYNNTDFNTKIPIGIVIHQNRSTINAVQTFPSVGYGWKQRSFDFIKAFGPLKISGYVMSPSASSAGGLLVTGGTAWVDGRNYIVDPNNPSYITEALAISTSKIYRYYQSGSDWKYDTNGGVGYTAIDPANYSNNGTLTPVGSNDWSIQRVFYFPNSGTKALYIYYGNATYPNETTALASVSTETFSEAPNTAANAIYLGYILARNDADFTVPASYTIYAASLFRAGGSGGAGGGSGATTLASLSDVSITSPTNGQPLVYNSITTKWENQSKLTASLSGNATTATSASYAGTASLLLGSIATASYAYTSSWALNFTTSSVTSASYISSSGVYGPNGYNSILSASYAITSSYSISASYSTSASYSITSSYSATSSYIASINKKVRTALPIMAVQGQTTYITTIPAIADEVGTELRVRENLFNASSCSLSTRVESAGAGAGFLKVQYSTDEATWNDLMSTVPSIIDLSIASTQIGSEVAIPSGAKTTGTYLRLITISGSGAGDAVSRFGNVTLNIIYDL